MIEQLFFKNSYLKYSFGYNIAGFCTSLCRTIRTCCNIMQVIAVFGSSDTSLWFLMHMSVAQAFVKLFLVGLSFLLFELVHRMAEIRRDCNSSKMQFACGLASEVLQQMLFAVVIYLRREMLSL